MQPDGTDVRQLTVNAATDHRPAWFPDGTRIAFRSDRDGDFEIYTMRSDSTDVRQLTTGDLSGSAPAWSP
jgi:Tol biopolymer transport system component